MSKIIDERFSNRYKGLVRTISLTSKNQMIIEYNFEFSNEVGHRFSRYFHNDELIKFSKTFIDKEVDFVRLTI